MRALLLYGNTFYYEDGTPKNETNPLWNYPKAPTEEFFDALTADIKETGFNVVILMDYGIPVSMFINFTKLFNKSAEKVGIKIIPSLYPIGYEEWDGNVTKVDKCY